MTGIICINKPKDITSFGVVAKVRGITREKKAGHTGTLDPMATGVLPIMLGGATRFLDFMPDSDKGYIARLQFGIETDTLDCTGNIIRTTEINVSRKMLEDTIASFRGLIEQVPPMYSAVSVNGTRLYDLARQGIEVQRQSRTVEIKKLELLSFDGTIAEIDVICSKGTYIRSLIDDIGKALGCPATMIELQRTLAMGFTLEDCVTISQLQDIKDNGLSFDEHIKKLERIFDPYDNVFISDAQAKRFSNGGALALDRIRKKINDKQLYKVYRADNYFLGLREGNFEKNELAVKRLLVRRD